MGVSDEQTCRPTRVVGFAERATGSFAASAFVCTLQAGSPGTLNCGSGLQQLPMPTIPFSKTGAGQPAAVAYAFGVSPSGNHVVGVACGPAASNCDSFTSTEQRNYFAVDWVFNPNTGAWTAAAIDDILGTGSPYRLLAAYSVNDYGDVGGFGCQVSSGNNCSAGSTYGAMRFSPSQRVAPPACSASIKSSVVPSDRIQRMDTCPNC